MTEGTLGPPRHLSDSRYLVPARWGFRIDDYKGHKRYHHSGSTSGFRNHMQQYPDERLTIIVLTNRAEPDVAPLADRVADLYL